MHISEAKDVNIDGSKFTAVIACGKFEYIRDGGVNVIHIGCLR